MALLDLRMQEWLYEFHIETDSNMLKHTEYMDLSGSERVGWCLYDDSLLPSFAIRLR